MYRALLHQTSMTNREIQTYPVQADPQKGPPPLSSPSVQSPTTPNQYNLLRNEEALPPLMDPKCTEPYYTKPVEPIQK